jgi:hypothetical protein
MAPPSNLKFPVSIGYIFIHKLICAKIHDFMLKNMLKKSKKPK